MVGNTYKSPIGHLFKVVDVDKTTAFIIEVGGDVRMASYWGRDQRGYIVFATSAVESWELVHEANPWIEAFEAL